VKLSYRQRHDYKQLQKLTESSNTLTVLISVVIPLYNKEQSAARAIRSVLSQCYPHFELIVVDDGSTDGSLEVAQRFSEPRMTVLTQSNKGVASARNRGISVAKGEYICFLDADDEYSPGFLDEIAKLISAKPDAALFCCRYKEVDEFGRPFVGNADLPETFFGEVTDFFLHYKHSRSLMCSSNICAKRSFIDAVGGFPDGQRIGEDIYLWLRIALLGAVMFSGTILSTVYRNAENRTISSGLRAIPYHTRYFLTENTWRQNQNDATIYQLMSFIFHNGLINVCGALMVNNKRVAAEFATLVQPHHPMLAFMVKVLALLPASVFLLGKRLRNMFTIRSIDGS
jgi:glycosyltransferase involved in cell wall biosynthesis